MFNFLKNFWKDLIGSELEKPRRNPPVENPTFIFEETRLQWCEMMQKIAAEERVQDENHQQKIDSLSLKAKELRRGRPSSNDATSELKRRQIDLELSELDKQERIENERYYEEKKRRVQISIPEKQLREAEWKRIVREGASLSSNMEEIPDWHYDTNRQKFITGFSMRERRLIKLKDGRYFVCVFSHAGVMKDSGRKTNVWRGHNSTEEMAIMEWTGLYEEPKLQEVIGSMQRFTEEELKKIAGK